MQIQLSSLKYLLTAALASGIPLAPASPAPDATIQRDQLEAHVRFLASDELRGRFTGTAEAARAGKYIADAARSYGLAGAVGDGAYEQALPFQRLVHDAAPELSVREATGAELAVAHGVEYTHRGGCGSVGELEVRIVEGPEDIPAEASAGLALYMKTRFSRARAWLAAAGHADGGGFGLIILRGSPKAGKRRGVPPPTRLTIVEEEEEPGALVVVARASLRDRLDDGDVKSVAYDSHRRVERLPSFNVVARLDGVGTPERPELKDEVVVLSAHYDHLRERPAAEEPLPDGEEAPDHIFNGADDDASGCAMLLELAEAFSAGPKPARTLVFLWATAEEIGIVGTQYYVEHPVLPLEQTIVNLNFEMVGRPDAAIGGAGKLWLTGPWVSNLVGAFQLANLEVYGDPHPEENFYYRSDNLPFVRKGVVGQTFSTYDLHKDYHRVSDEADTLDYEHLRAATDVAYRACRLIADGALDPSWEDGAQEGR